LDSKHHLKIDLHIHSTASDGTLSPHEIVKLAIKLKLGAISITDHDTVDGSKEVLNSGVPDFLKFVTGIEISASPPSFYSCPGSFHILGYALNIDDPILNSTLEVLQHSRKNRNPGIIERLKRLGFDISLTEIVKEAGNCQLGRPHIAQVMVMKGFAQSIDEAFDNYLGKGRPAYIDKYRIECHRAIEVILNAGGIPVLAHPFLLNPQSTRQLENLIVVLKEMGLKGIEVYYPEHSLSQTELYIALAKKFDLLMTGGTDFHGAIKPDIQLGFGRGDFFVPYHIYETLIHFRQNPYSAS
jgi:predicted metal-dependent phosphoesterase TrpH